MLNESVKPVNVLILTEFSLSGYEFVAQERVKLGLINEYQADEILEIITSHRALNSRNAKLVHENDELMAENEMLKEEIKELNHYAELSREQSNNLKDQIEALEELK